MSQKILNQCVIKKATLFHIGSFCLSQFFLSACSNHPIKTADQVQKLSEQENFEQAIDLYHVLPSVEQEKVSLEDIQKKQKNYLSALFKASEKTKKVDFFEAQDLLESGQDKLPNNIAIQKALSQLEAERLLHSLRYENAYNLETGRFLIAEAKLLKQLQVSQGREDKFNLLVNRHEKSRKIIAPLLGEHGLILYQRGKSSSALTYLSVAQQLQGNKDWQDAITSITSDKNKRRSSRAKKAQREKAKYEKTKALQEAQTQKAMNALQKQFDKALKQRQFTQAQKMLKNIKQKDKSGDYRNWTIQKDAQLTRVTQTQLKKDIELGQRHYSSGDIDDAIATWKKAQQYAPNNSQLKEHIKRAETFQARFESLKN